MPYRLSLRPIVFTQGTLSYTLDRYTASHVLFIHSGTTFIIHHWQIHSQPSITAFYHKVKHIVTPAIYRLIAFSSRIYFTISLRHLSYIPPSPSP